MIPQFPSFKKLELSDQDEITTYTSHFLPYSDFNFTSMWSWNIKNTIEVSYLHKNLVVKFTDYITKEDFYSFLGNVQCEETIKELMSFLKMTGNEGCLKLLPECSINTITSDNYAIKEDKNNFDYLYDVESLSCYSGGPYMTKRNLVNRLLAQAPSVTAMKLDITDRAIQEQLMNLNDNWIAGKLSKDKDSKFENELIALNKIFEINSNNFLTIGVFDGEQLIAFCINEILNDQYAISHFAKTKQGYSGSHAYLMRENARFLHEAEVQYLNFEQDLGIESLRYSKNSYRPAQYLKKYQCTICV